MTSSTVVRCCSTPIAATVILAGPRLAERYPAASVDACPKRLQHPMSGLASSAACQTEAPVLRSPIVSETTPGAGADACFSRQAIARIVGRHRALAVALLMHRLALQRTWSSDAL